MGMTSVVLRQLKKKIPTNHNLIMQVNEVTQKIFLKSILDGVPYKVRLFFGEDKVLTDIGYEAIKKNNSEENKSKDELLINKEKLKNSFCVLNCFINGHDEMAIKSKEIWFLFYPEGYCQEVTFIISRTMSDVPFSYILNPFNGIIEDKL
jgi:hypothetical protein